MAEIAHILYSGKLLREIIFANFTVLWLFAKVFSTKFGGMASFVVWHKQATCESFLCENRTFHQFAKVFFAKIVLFTNSRKFSLRESYFSPIRESFLL